jgi:hypothetical protein
MKEICHRPLLFFIIFIGAGVLIRQGLVGLLEMVDTPK